MEILIENGDQLKEWFFNTQGHFNFKTVWAKGVMVNAKVRREVLTDVSQGKIIILGKVKTIEFENMTGGVYRAFLNIT